MNIVVAISVAAVNRDPDVLQQRAIFILELRGVRSANGEKRAVLLRHSKTRIRGLLLDARRHQRLDRAARPGFADGALRVNPRDNQSDRPRGPSRPACIARRFLISHEESLPNGDNALMDLEAEYR